MNSGHVGRFWIANIVLVTGIVQILQLPLTLNQEVVMMSKFNMQEMLDVIVNFKCDELWMVPRESLMPSTDHLILNQTLTYDVILLQRY